MDIVFIRDLRIETVVGVYDWERQIRQTVSFDIEMAADVSHAAGSDSIEDALDYKAVAKRVIELVEASNCKLVETLAEKVAATILDEFQVGWVKVALDKPGALRGSRSVGVIIERGTRPA